MAGPTVGTVARGRAAGVLGDAGVSAARRARIDIMRRVDERLDAFLGAERRRWAAVDGRGAVPVDAVTSLVAAGGKRLRPAFCVAGFLSAGGDPADGRVVDSAAGVELVHTGALIHDDVLDASELRRGTPTVHVEQARGHEERGWLGEPRRYGEGVAIISGVLATVYADRLTRDLPPAARDIWGEMLTEIQIGQFLDMAVAAEGVVEPDLLRWVAICKSGRYSIHRPLVLGAALAGRGDLAPAFEEYGETLGEAFQLRDDLIGVFGDSGAAGKPVGLDLEQHKMTLLLAEAAQRDGVVRELISAREWDTARILERLGESRELIERRIAGLVERACGAIDRAELDIAWRTELTEMAYEVAYRNR
ncbi:polyprenyl synthetase family protein [Streptomyces yaizuensis]|uniref:Polyprenyl synthetase family protein n=1 Tax=Streptomyces yaizuensis TaxID=2989713 RepID=A0ABQ5P9Z8_9ACTN|nr:polyprenyl synthetase family protein [Streptomyces sp. YSPA8]GLF99414.1 polyprenyl synthetase family protein [Streptomyces sp. YSPA8]